MLWSLNLGPEELFDRVLREIPESSGTPIPGSNWGEVLENFANKHRSSWRVHALVEIRVDGSKRIVASTFLGYLLVYKWGRKLMVGA